MPHRTARTAPSGGIARTAKDLKRFLETQVRRLDQPVLKQILVACGAGLLATVSVVALLKCVPVGLALLAVLGLGLVLQFWKEIRRVLTFT